MQEILPPTPAGLFDTKKSNVFTFDSDEAVVEHRTATTDKALAHDNAAQTRREEEVEEAAIELQNPLISGRGSKIVRSISAAPSSPSPTTSPSPSKGSKSKTRRVTLTIQQFQNSTDDPESILAALSKLAEARIDHTLPIIMSSPRMAPSPLQLCEGPAATYHYSYVLSPSIAIKEEEATKQGPEPASLRKASDISDEAMVKSSSGSGAVLSKARALDKLNRFEELRKISRIRRGLSQRTGSDGSDSRGVFIDHAIPADRGVGENAPEAKASQISRSKSSMV